MYFAASARANLLTLATAYGRANNLTIEQVSKRLYGNIGFIRGFVGGEQSVSFDKFDRMVDEFKKNWPPDLDWPWLHQGAAKYRPPSTRKFIPRPLRHVAKQQRIS